MFWEKKLENWVEGIRKTSPLPLRLELWTGQKYDLSPNEAPKVVIRVPALESLSYLLKPTLDNLGTAYVEGKIEVQGTLNDMITMGNSLADIFDTPASTTAAKFRHYFGGRHNRKIDAPSGTAIALADAINESLDNSYHYKYDRSSERVARDPKEIGIQAMRGGTIVGEHDIMFAGRDEVITFTHTAYSREIFAKGAVEAAKFLAGKPAGLYDMSDVIG